MEPDKSRLRRGSAPVPHRTGGDGGGRDTPRDRSAPGAVRPPPSAPSRRAGVPVRRGARRGGRRARGDTPARPPAGR
ncbi:hypothetical protein ADL04_10810 [Streptomyces sp. NRRL B-3648]|nr:hypothetical protein ADL04_10810 [Streptomyces sp. NRRL B-3648]